jgi:hypothetical protein
MQSRKFVSRAAAGLSGGLMILAFLLTACRPPQQPAPPDDPPKPQARAASHS